MEILHRSCCGIDVHKQFLVACLLTMDDTGRPHQEIRRFSTMTGELLACVDWLQQAQCSAIAMESTGVYWQAPYNLMEGHARPGDDCQCATTHLGSRAENG